MDKRDEEGTPAAAGYTSSVTAVPRHLIRALKVAYSLKVVCSFRAKASSALHPPQGALDSASLKGKARFDTAKQDLL